MKKITVKVEGMMCGMCEAHINDAVRSAFPIKKITSSHAKGETVIISEQDIDPEKLAKTIEATGYKVSGMECGEYVKKGIFGFKK